MEKITKKQVEAIRKGNHAVLMDCLDFLLDTYQEDKWDLGYQACLADMGVRSYRLAEYILKHTTVGGEPIVPDDLEGMAKENLAKVIEDYFSKHLK